MRKFKRSIARLLAALMIVSSLPFAAFTANAVYWHGGKGQDLSYEIESNGNLYIEGVGEPQNWSYYYNSWKRDNSNIKKVVIGEGITCIGADAFSDMDSIISVSIPKAVIKIDKNAFKNCTSLTEVIYYDGTKEEWDQISIESGNECLINATVHFPADETVIGSGSCGENLTWTLLSDGFLTISGEGEMYDFDGNKNAIAVPWYGNVVTGVVIENGVTSIGKEAFFYQHFLKSVSIPDSVTSIGDNAFNFCNSLTSVTISDSVTSIGIGAFYNCASLLAINVDSKNIYYCSEDGVLFNKSKSELIQFPGGKSGEYAIPDSVTKMGSSAFRDCTLLTSITIPNGITSIGREAFSNCTSLESITIPDSVTSIGYSAFEGCTSLESIILPGSVTSIGNWAFNNCTSLESIVIPDKVTSVGGGMFASCTSLTSITIPDSVTSIGASTFSGCSSLRSVTIPNSVISIGDSAFYKCSSLKSVTIPDSTVSMGIKVFYGCSEFTSITIPNSITSIAKETFRGCTSLVSIIISDSVINIGDSAFYNCKALTDIYYTGSEDDWSYVKIGSSNDYLKNATIHYNYNGEPLECKHVWVEANTVSATCVLDGSVEYTCTACGETKYEIIPATGVHTPGEWSVVVPATCTEDGVYENWCTICGEVLSVETIPALGHTPGASELAYPATCMSTGKYEIRCTVCDEIVNSWYVPRLGHNLKRETHKVPTCTEDGEYWDMCTRCWNRIGHGPIDALGHDYVSKVVAPTPSSNGYTECTCTRCGDSYRYNYTEYVPENEDIQRVLTLEGPDSISTDDLSVQLDLKLDGNAYPGIWAMTLYVVYTRGWNVSAVENGGLWNYGELEYNTDVYNSSSLYSKFNIDPDVYDIMVIHAESDSVFNIVSENGTVATITFELPEGAMPGDKFEASVFYDEDDPFTVNSNGEILDVGFKVNNYSTVLVKDESAKAYIESVTAKAGDTVSVDLVISDAPELKMLSINDLEYDETKLELVSGKWAVKAILSDWDSETNTGVAVFSKNTNVNGTVFTFTFKVKDGVEECTVPVSCNFSARTKPNGGVETAVAVKNIAGAVNIVKCIHEWKILTINATCTENGSVKTYCVLCGEVVSEEIIPATGHKMDRMRVEPTCTENGTIKTYCIWCGEVVSEEIIPATGHIMSSMYVEPTCAADGYTYEICDVCGYEQDRTVIPALGHNYEYCSVDPTCTDSGYSYYHCVWCGVETDYTVIGPLGHEECTAEYIPETCYEDGYVRYECARCGVFLRDEVIPAAHKYEATVYQATPYAVEGYTVYTCAVCGDTYTGDYNTYVEKGDAKAVLGCVTGRSGDIVTVTLDLMNMPAIKSLAINNLIYDSSRLELVDGEWNTAGAMISHWDNSREAGVAAFISNTQLDGTVLTFTFRILEGVDDCEIPVYCTFIANTMNEAGSEVEVDVNNYGGRITVNNVIRGDVNGDGMVNSNDAIYLLRYVGIPEYYTINQSGDMNGDGCVDSDDAIYLLYHVMFAGSEDWKLYE